MASIAAQRQLANALKKSHNEPIEGFCVELVNDDNLFEWKIYLEGPQDSPYEGGIFQAIMKFPPEYPMLPPSLQFTSEFWHPNVYPDGRVCISILHAPGEDAMSGELPEERWLPTQTVGTVLLSVISMLNDPNTSSPANVDASVMWRNEREEYIKKCKGLVEKANAEMPEGIVIPHPDTNPAEKQKELEKMKIRDEPLDLYGGSEGSDEFFPESGGEDSVNSAFYDSDEGSVVDEADIWKEDTDQSNSANENSEASISAENEADVKQETEKQETVEKKVTEVKDIEPKIEAKETKKEEKETEKTTNIETETNEPIISVDATKSNNSAPQDKLGSNTGEKKKKKDCCIM
mmetsp:Transcript_126762/g.189107  ORF Transcript_126762/g.189107 Transcript_126762/m.189107 type:complete len:348 (-) Transcript_126762:32-1075(-)